jgi:hypothetical protein
LVKPLAQPLSTSSVRHSNGLSSLFDMAFDFLLYGDLLFRFPSVNQLLVSEVLAYPIKEIE